MAKKWKDIRGTFTPEEEATIKAKMDESEKEMTLFQLRRARNMTQVTLARALNVNQGAVSVMEKRTDMYVSTLRNYIEAMGGELKITAEFPDGAVQIEQFENAAEA